MEIDGNPMHPAQRLQNAPRCKAKAKRTGTRCSAPAVNGCAVCRMHGARGGAPFGKQNGNWQHGGRSQDVAEVRSITRKLMLWPRSIGPMGKDFKASDDLDE